MNFARWLDIANQKHEERLEGDSKIVIILDGIDNFFDQEDGTEESADWLPFTFPNHVQVIILTRKGSKAMNHFKSRHCPVLYMDPLKDTLIEKLFNDYVSEDFKDYIS